MGKKKKAKDPTWERTRMGFWVMVGIWILIIAWPILAENLIISIIWIASVIFTFINSVLHLKKFKEKVFAIVALSLSSIWLLVFTVRFIIGVIQGA